MTSQFTTEPIAERDVAAGIESGEAALDAFFSKHSLINDRRGLGRTFVRRRQPGEADLPEIIGFYTLSMADVDPAFLPARGLPRYPTPVALIGRLAVDRRAKGKGFGRELLIDALSRVLAAEVSVGCFGVIVDAKTALAVTFYERFGFIQLSEGAFPLRMFLSMKTIRAAAEASQPEPA